MSTRIFPLQFDWYIKSRTAMEQLFEKEMNEIKEKEKLDRKKNKGKTEKKREGDAEEDVGESKKKVKTWSAYSLLLDYYLMYSL